MSGQQREVEFRFLAEPGDVTRRQGARRHGHEMVRPGRVRGAVGWSGQYCVTVALGGIQFVAPILIGDLVSVRCKLIRTGNSSMHFAVDVSARDLKTAAERQSTSCIIISSHWTAPTASRSQCPLAAGQRRRPPPGRLCRAVARPVEGDGS
jgi:hypothetical protein